MADPRHWVAVTLILTQTRAGAVSSVGSWQKKDRRESTAERQESLTWGTGIITQGAPPARGAGTRPRLGITDSA